MNKSILVSFTILLHLYALISFAQDNKFIPNGSGFEIINHTHYHLGYSEKYEQALWVTYELTPSETSGSVKRTDNFRSDPNVSRGSASLADYKGSGYDRGHLAPAGDMTFSSEAMSESFYLSNMSPQDPGLNRGPWRIIESVVRDWTVQLGSIYIVTGPILKDRNDVKTTIGPNKVAVPKRYYKIIFSEDSLQGIGFIYWNMSGTATDYLKYVVSIDEIEEATGLDFFPQLDDTIENRIESNKSLEFWQSFGSETETRESDSYTNSERLTESVQCNGIAVSTGVRCRNKTLNSNGFCHHHQNQVGTSVKTSTKTPPVKSTPGRCTAITQAGSRCKRTAQAGSSTCWQH